VKLFYSDTFVLPLPEGHRFPMDKYARVRRRLMDHPDLASDEFRVPGAASNRALLRAHCPTYLEQLETGRLPERKQRRIGFPWSPAMVERSRRSVGATMGAAQAALADGIGVNLAGGTHHAFHDYGGGFCVFNDTVVAARWLQARGWAERVLIVDLDVHQGDGTAALCADDASIFTLSLHGEKNYPARKPASDLDVPLPDDTGDEAYLAALDQALDEALERFDAQVCFYLAGADPYAGDRLGRLALSKDGLARRDQRVFTALRGRGLPVAVAMAGGYAPQIDDIVDIHVATVLEARRWADDAVRAAS